MLASHCPEFESRWTHEYEMFKVGSDRENIGPFAKPSSPIVWPPVVFSRLRQQLRERRQNLWHAKKFTEVLAKANLLHSCVHFALREAIEILSNRDFFVITSYDHRWYQEFFISRRQYDGNKKLPDCLTKATRLRETLTISSCSHRIIVRWYRDGITVLVMKQNFSRYSACRMCHWTTKFELIMSSTYVIEPWACKKTNLWASFSVSPEQLYETEEFVILKAQ